MNSQPTRRDFLQKSALFGTSIFASHSSASAIDNNKREKPTKLKCHIFSKHLQFLSYADMSDAAAEMGFDGIDLTVRPNGHVEPEKVKDQLPKAIAYATRAGLTSHLITTAITSASHPFTIDVVSTAAKLGIRDYRLGYYRYPPDSTIPHVLQKIREDIEGLATLNKQLNIRGAYQNHAGLYVGSAIWEIWQMLININNHHVGCQYDIRHASVEGAQSWPIGLRLIAKKINTIVLKDYKWQKINGKWSIINVPIGDGMVDFNAYFRLLKHLNIHVPISLHCEYALGGAEHGHSHISIPRQHVLRAIKNDLIRVRRLWNGAR